MVKEIRHTKKIASWWSRNQNGHCFGFVLTKDYTGVRRIYMGTASCLETEKDEADIVKRGGKLNSHMLKSMLAGLKLGANHD